MSISSKIIGFRHPFWSSTGPDLLGGVVDFMRTKEPWRLVTANKSYGEMEDVKIDGDWIGDGVILFRATESELENFRRRGMAVVLTSTEGPDGGFPRAVPDNRRIGREVAGHLLGCGFSSFAFLARGETYYREAEFAPGFRSYARERFAGFREELARASVEPRIHYLRGRPLWEAHTWREVETEVMGFLQSLPTPCGLFAVDDSLAAVVLRAADTLGLKVPDDLAVMGHGDDHSYCYSSFPALSSIASPAREMGRQAAELLWKQMNGIPVPPRVELAPGPVCERESTDTLAIEDPVVKPLVRWIRMHSAVDSIRVSDLCERSGLSATTVKTRFSATLGHSPKTEIKQARLKHLTHLLKSSDFSLSEIAQRMNFASAHELSRFFHSGTGMRPSEFRQRQGGARGPQPSGLAAVIFDMDGTLFDSEKLFFRAFREAFREQGGNLTEEEYFENFAGTTNEHIESTLAAKADKSFSPARFGRAWRDHFDQLLENEGLEGFSDVHRAVGELRQLGLRLAVASSSELADVERLLRLCGLREHFDSLTGGDEVEHSKPAPDIFLLAAERIGCEPGTCLVVEDSRAGVEAASEAGMRVVHVHRSKGPAPNLVPGAKRVRSLDEIDWPDFASSSAPRA